MADWVLSANESFELVASNVAVSRTAAANTKGTYTELVASTANAYEALVFTIVYGPSGGGDTFLTDVAVGALGSEQIVIPDLLVDHARGADTPDIILRVPLYVPAGTRIAARVQDVTGSGTRRFTMSIAGIYGGANVVRGRGQVSAYGADTTTTNGTLIDQGGTANTWGAWTQLTSSTSRDHKGFFAVLGHDQQTTGMGLNYFDIQVGVGAGGSEVPIAYGFAQSGNSAKNVCLGWPTVGLSIPAGSRLSARCKATGIASAQRHLTMALYGM